MAQRLKILSINFPFKNSEVVQQGKLSTPYALFDYDVVVIRPYIIPPVDGIEWPAEKYQREMLGKIPEIETLLDQSGLLIVILDRCVVRKYHPSQWSYYSEGTSYCISNYDFLHYEFSGCIRNGTGERLQYVDNAHPFVPVLRSSKVQWSAYIEQRPYFPFDNMKVFARNGKTSVVGSTVHIRNGSIVFLPNLVELDETRFFEACRECRAEREGTPAPPWAKKVFVPGASILTNELSKLTESISQLESRAKQITEELAKVEQHKRLLYEKGKIRLEPAVRAAFDQIGFKTTPGEQIPGTDYEIDGRTTQGSTSGVLEVKGSKKQITFDELSPFIVKIVADQQSSNKSSKGILVGNGLCETPPEERLGDGVFSAHVLRAASDHSVALVNSVELYWLLCGILGGAVNNLDAVREHILGSRGYVDLRPFCSHSPFKSPQNGLATSSGQV